MNNWYPSKAKCPYDTLRPVTFTKEDKKQLELMIGNRERQIAGHQSKIDALKAEIAVYQQIISKIR